MTFEEFFETYGFDYETTRGLARLAWDTAIEESAVVAFDMPLQSGDRHSYRWSDTGKAMAWDIAYAIRKLKNAAPQVVSNGLAGPAAAAPKET
jgi:hypothetical protein